MRAARAWVVVALIGPGGMRWPIWARSLVVSRMALLMAEGEAPKRWARVLWWADQRSFRAVARSWSRGDMVLVPVLAVGRLVRVAAGRRGGAG